MRRASRSRIIKRQIIETQKTIVKGVLLIIGVTLILIFLFGDHGLFQLYKLKEEKKEVQNQIYEFRKNRENLISEKTRLENDLNYIEKLAREKYRMAKPGEKVFKVIPKESNKNSNK